MGSQWGKLRSGLGIVFLILVLLTLGTVIFVSRGALSTGMQSNGNAASSVQASQDLAYPGPGTPLVTVTVPAALPSPPPVTPTAIPLDTPYHAISQGEPPQWDQDTLTKRSTDIIYGTVIDVQPARWSTPNGIRPKNPFDNQSFIYTPVKIQVVEMLKGKQQQEVLIAVTGGIVGADSMEAIPVDQYTFEKGQEVILYLPQGAPYLNGVIHGFYERYTITASGRAKNENQEIPLEELLDNIRIAVRK